MTSLKERLIKELGPEKAAQILSEQGKEMRAKVKNPYNHFQNKEAAREAQKKGVAKRREKKLDKSQAEEA